MESSTPPRDTARAMSEENVEIVGAGSLALAPSRRIGLNNYKGLGEGELMKRRICIAATTVMVAAGLIGAVAAPASAAPATFASIVVCQYPGGGEPITFGVTVPANERKAAHQASIQHCLDTGGTVIEESLKRVPPLL
jgi:hypothetical protein